MAEIHLGGGGAGVCVFGFESKHSLEFFFHRILSGFYFFPSTNTGNACVQITVSHLGSHKDD